jgi:hypothetical protein
VWGCVVKRYEGRRKGHDAEVTVDGRPLNPRFDLWGHSPSGFEWGYGGSGTAQLALALLADHLADDDQAVLHHQDFKRIVVAGLSYPGWTLTSAQVEESLRILKSGSLVSEKTQKGGPHERRPNRVETLQ